MNITQLMNISQDMQEILVKITACSPRVNNGEFRTREKRSGQELEVHLAVVLVQREK